MGERQPPTRANGSAARMDDIRPVASRATATQDLAKGLNRLISHRKASAICAPRTVRVGQIAAEGTLDSVGWDFHDRRLGACLGSRRPRVRILPAQPTKSSPSNMRALLRRFSLPRLPRPKTRRLGDRHVPWHSRPIAAFQRHQCPWPASRPAQDQLASRLSNRHV